VTAGPLFIAMAIALFFCVGSAIVYRPPSRPCHQCGERVAITARRCRKCGYLFSIYRSSR
jgi:hypothetical protein